MKRYLGIDLGATSIKLFVNKDESNDLIEVYRFKNIIKNINNSYVWDVDYIFNNILYGIHKVLDKYPDLETIGIDSWGCDYVLLDNYGKVINPVYCYRDKRTKESVSLVHEIIPFDDLYQINGIQFQEFNTIYQLYWDKLHCRLDNAKYFMQIPSYIIYLLTGCVVQEITNLGTSGLLDINTLEYSSVIINKLKLPSHLFLDIKNRGESYEIKKDFNFKKNLKVFLVPSHDTASCIEGIGINYDVPYISSGTWSLLGIKTNKPVINDITKKYNYSNELGPNYIRLQKNIMGLWIIERLSDELNLTIQELIDISIKENEYILFDVNDNSLFNPFSMVDAIKELINNDKKEIIIKSSFHSLAYSYKKAIEELEEIMYKNYQEIVIVGGGSKNDYLNELTMVYTNKKVNALKIEATALGNILNQRKIDNETRSN